MDQHPERVVRSSGVPHGDASHDQRPALRRRVPSIVSGVILVALGVLFTLEQLALIEHTRLLYDWWPLALIAFGLSSGGHVLTGIGVWLLIGKHGFFGLDYSSSWPIILIVIGLGIIGSSFRDQTDARKGNGNPTSEGPR